MTGIDPQILAMPLIAFNLAIAPPAHGYDNVNKCDDHRPKVECATVTVPLDHFKKDSDGKVHLTVRSLRAKKPAKTAVMAIDGGPGGASIDSFDDFEKLLRPALKDRDLVVYDQRGTPRSSDLDCGNDGDGSPRYAHACGKFLGGRAKHFATRDSVEDIESLRQKGGYQRLVLYGVSYGTKVVQAYAAKYPERVESVVLESPVKVSEPDVLDLESLAVVPKAMRELCHGGRCESVTPDLAADLAAVAKRVRKHDIEGDIVTPAGRRESDFVDETSLLDLAMETDSMEPVNVALPAALAAARRGDNAPLLRLGGALYGTGRPDYGDYDDGVADGANVAALCGDLAFGAGKKARARRDEIRRMLSRQPSAAFGPFSSKAAYETTPGYMCSGWPYTPAKPDHHPRPRRIPTLVLNGLADMRTPARQAERIAAAIPGAKLVEVGGEGHAPSYYDSCAEHAVQRFLSHKTLRDCSDGVDQEPITRVPPRFLNDPDLAARTLKATELTILDAIDWLGTEYELTGETQTGGLRSGYAELVDSDIVLHNYEFVPGVKVSGTLVSGDHGTFIVNAAAPGTVTVDSRRITGKLGGHTARGRFRIPHDYNYETIQTLIDED